MTGGVVSLTVTVNDAPPELPRVSLAVHVTVVTPSGKIAPLTGVQLTARTPSTMSDADAANVNIAPVAAVASTIAFAGTATVGPVVSRTVTVNVFVPVLVCVSVAEHVTVVVAIGNVDPLAGVQLTGRTPSTMSDAVAVKVNAAPAGPVASTVAFAGTVTTGGVVSRTCTVNVFVPTLPCVSVAEQLTVVVPIAKIAPLAGVQVTGRGPSTMSDAVGAGVNVNAAPVAAVASTMAFAGTVTAGAVVSRTSTVNVFVPTLP